VSVVPLNAELHVVGVVAVQVAVGVQIPLKQHELSPLHLLLVAVPLVEASQVVTAVHVAVGTQSPFKQHELSPVQVLTLVDPLWLIGHVA
jgi:hypothetical protein